MRLYLFIVGFISVLGQVVILRELNVSFFGIELVYIIAIGLWLFGSAGGAAFGRKESFPAAGGNIFLLVAAGILFLGEPVFIRSARKIFGGVAGAYLSPEFQTAILISSVLPVSVLLGMMFRRSARVYIGFNKTLAGAYAIESAGGILGGIISTLLLKFGIQNFDGALLCSLAAFGGAAFYAERNGMKITRAASLALAATIIPLTAASSSIDKITAQWNHPNIKEVRDTPYGRITVSSYGGQVSVYENDALSFETEGTAAEEFIQLSMLQHKNPQTVLLLGGGIEGLIIELNKYDLKKIDYVELNEALIRMTAAQLPAVTAESLNKKEVSVIIEDPRKYLGMNVRYDVILSAMPEPSSGQSNRFFTAEFFKQCANRLNPGGITAFKLRSAENLWTPQLALRNAAIFSAVKSAFPYSIVMPGSVNIIIASHSPLEENPDRLSERLEERRIDTRLVNTQYIKYIFTNDRYYGIKKILSEKTAALNSDLRPVCYTYTNIIWLSKFFPEAGSLVQIYGDPSKLNNKIIIIGLTAFFILILILVRNKISARKFVLVFIAGFSGMVAETVLLLYYQSQCGVLYQDIGILLTAFMTGLAAGSYITSRLAVKREGMFFISRIPGLLFTISFGLICFALYFILGEEEPGFIITFLLLLSDGLFVAGIFAYAGLRESKKQSALISPLYSADLLGGGIGSLAASLILIPVTGLAVTCVIIGAAAVLSLILI